MDEPYATSQPLFDTFQRQITYARLAVTSACNLRCGYCLSEAHEPATLHQPLLSTAELCTIIELLAKHGIQKLRFTGGEPLLRSDIVALIAMARQHSSIRTIGLTTNGLLLLPLLPRLLDAGLDSVNLSLDTLNRHRYFQITRRDLFPQAEAALHALLATPSLSVKLNVVMLRGINSDELTGFVELTKEHNITVRFLELQPFDDHQIWKTGRFLRADRLEEMLLHAYPALQRVQGEATQHFSYCLSNYKGALAIIPAYTRAFCEQCNRLRITSSGKLISCLYEKDGLELLPLLRNGAKPEEFAALLQQAVLRKPANGHQRHTGAVRTSMSEIGG
uniref:GTP 3',8-cyclase n=1 Tax=Chlorobium chlorochromatii (strain CaD3) TaxID=340177 RepID=Q3AP86_CHLCH